MSSEDRKKYPRTFHADWSLSLINDDRRIPTYDGLVGREVIVTEKYDGENTTLASTYSHARSLDSVHHVSRDWAKKAHGEIKHLIPDDWRIVIENCYAKHAIWYRRETGNALPSFAMGLSVWDTEGALSWDETLMIFDDLGIIPARTIYRGIWNEELFRQIAREQNPNLIEGYVIRTVDRIQYGKWFMPACKYVREKHVAQGSEFWRTEEIVSNELTETNHV
jgi:hypothetical protein